MNISADNDRPLYPEHDKQGLVEKEMRIIGEFLDWVEVEYDYFFELRKDFLVAEFFGIDLRVIEKERRAMLDEMTRLSQEMEPY